MKDLDPGIAQVVLSFNDAGIETAESCQGGEGHAYEWPTVVLLGGSANGWRALAVCKDLRFPVRSLERIWFVRDGDPIGPTWHVTFRSTVEAFR